MILNNFLQTVSPIPIVENVKKAFRVFNYKIKHLHVKKFAQIIILAIPIKIFKRIIQS